MGRGSFQLIERIGVGGMAEVFRARMTTPDGFSGDVTVKRILPHLSEDPDYRQMFMDEARIAATLNHPNIVKLLDLGRLEDGQLFLALEYIDGLDLEKLARRSEAGGMALPFAVSIYAVGEVLKGLHHAHNLILPDGRPMALVHRDVTPSNVLVSTRGDVKLSDFGVAKAAVRGGRTVAGVVKGNALYMAPEQISSGDLDARTDVYAAGLLLYTLLAGKHPFESLAIGALIDRILVGAIPPLQQLNPNVPRGLEAIISTATARNPENRFPTAATFHSALQSYVVGNEIVAGAPELAAILARLSRDHGGASLGGAPAPSIVGRLEPLIAASIETTPLPSSDSGRFDSLDDLAETVRRAEAPGEERTPETSPAYVDEPTPLLGALGGSGEVSPTLPLLARDVVPAEEPDEHPTQRSLLRETDILPGRPAPSDWARKGVPLSKTPPPVLPVDPDSEPTFVEPPSPTLIAPPIVKAPAPTPTPPSEPTPTVPQPATVDTLEPDPEPSGTVDSIGPAPSEPFVLRGHRQAVSALAVLPDGTRLLSASHDQTVRLWDLTMRSERAVLKGHRAAITSLALSNDGSTAISAGRDRVLKIWDINAVRAGAADPQPRTLAGHEGWIFAVAIHAETQRALSAGMDRSIRVWDLAAGLHVRTLFGHWDTIAALAMFADGSRALSGGYDRTVKLWDLERGFEVASLECENSVRAVAVSPDGRYGVSGGADAMVSVWDLTRGLRVHYLGGHLEPVVALAWSRDGRWIASGSYDGTARLWNASTGKVSAIFEGVEPVMSIAFAPDGSFLLVGRADGTVERLAR